MFADRNLSLSQYPCGLASMLKCRQTDDLIGTFADCIVHTPTNLNRYGGAKVQLVSETKPQVRRDRLLRLPEVEVATGCKKSTIYLLMKQRKFPSCVSITNRMVAWPESAILQWVQDRITLGVAVAEATEIAGQRTKGVA